MFNKYLIVKSSLFFFCSLTCPLHLITYPVDGYLSQYLYDSDQISNPKFLPYSTFFTPIPHWRLKKTPSQRSGVRQGGPESPLIFNLYIAFVMRLFIEKGKQLNIDFFDHSFRINSKSFTRDVRSQLKQEKKNSLESHYWNGAAMQMTLFYPVFKVHLKASIEYSPNSVYP